MSEYKMQCLIVDDQQSIRKLCMTVAASLGLEVAEAESAEAALDYLLVHAPEIMIVDLHMENMTGLQLLEHAKRLLPRTEIAIMTGYGSVETAVQAMKLGAYDYITKPFRIDDLKAVLQRMLEKARLVAENNFLRECTEAETNFHGIVGSSPCIHDVLRMIARLKDTRTPVLISGESGTGKELVARAIHFRGALAHGPFVAVDCGSLVPTLIESELFGHEKGAFTGALRAKEGLFAAASGGTIFLDEVGELPQEMQAKLLRVLQEKEIRPVGSNHSRPVDVRVIAATNRDLEAAYRSGNFRKDLYFRLNVVAVHVPALRERKSDIPALVHWFLERHAKARQMTVSQKAMQCLFDYDWPGNVRELENCIEHAVALGHADVIDVADLPTSVRAKTVPATPAPASQSDLTDLEVLERVTIQRVFQQVNGDKMLAQKMLGISRATLYRKLKRYHIGMSQSRAHGKVNPNRFLPS